MYYVYLILLREKMNVLKITPPAPHGWLSRLRPHMSTINSSRWAAFDGPVKVSHSVHADTGSSSLEFDCWFEDRLLNPSFGVETQTAKSAACMTWRDISVHDLQSGRLQQETESSWKLGHQSDTDDSHYGCVTIYGAQKLSLNLTFHILTSLHSS